MDIVLILQVAALILLFTCSAFFSSAETAFFSTDSIRLNRIRRIHPRAADLIERILSSPPALLSTLLIGNTLVNVLASDVGYSLADRLLGPVHGETVAIPAMIVLLLLLGEVTPKRIAIRIPERLAALYAPLIRTVIRLFTPVRILLEKASLLLRRHLELRPRPLTEAEFLTALVVGEEEGVMDREERTMVDGIVRLQSTRARDVMTPRVDLVGLDLEGDPNGYARTARESRLRYLPLYRRTLDRIEGLLDVGRFLLNGDNNVPAATVPALFVPETATLSSLLSTFQKENGRVAVVVDEFGGTAGLITRGDILEAIISYVDEKRQPEEASIEPAGRQTWLIDGMVSLDDLNRALGLQLEAEGVDRMAGWVIAQAGRIPKPGEALHGDGCTVTVKRVRQNRILLVLLQKTDLDDAEAEA